ncbi:hypothetical protein [Micromonospora radicis]|uniref:Uncharacterized protein n=1 Tax=Micromonospora radicis TaxID=1894971 RepID=A0A418MNR7_9ACTN|nr:hypothetical protein [Micromonospora radicis]RIV32734.1 hypothetical protein D2L64_24565 [Micromonospora radicis]
MSSDRPGQADPPPAGVTSGWPRRLFFVGEASVPDLPLPVALRAAAVSSLVGTLSGLVVMVVAVALGWDNDIAGVTALGAFGLPRVRRGYRLRVVVALTVTAAGCLVAGVLLTGPLPAPWDLFLPLAFALTAGSQAGTAAAYLGRT